MNIKNIINSTTKTLLDVRTPEELLSEGKIPNAISIPMNDIPEKLEEIKKFSLPIIVFCKAGARAEKVTNYLLKQGISEVYNGGGFQDIQNLINS